MADNAIPRLDPAGRGLFPRQVQPRNDGICAPSGQDPNADKGSSEQTSQDDPPADGKDEHERGSPDPLEEIVEQAVQASDGDHTSVGDLLDAFGSRSLGPIALLSGLIVILPPLGMVPGIPAVVGLTLFLFSVQFIFGKRRIWLPQRLEKASIKRKRLEEAQKKSAKWLKRLDKLFSERLDFMSTPMMQRVAAVVVNLLALLLIPLELVPGAVAIPGWALIFFGVGLMARDGIVLLLAFSASAGALWALFALSPWF